MRIGLILALFLTSITTVSSVNITCNPEKYDYDYPPGVKCCKISGDFIASSEYEQLIIIDNSNVFKGFLADQKSITYLPNGIEKCCGAIEVLMIKNSGLKDITSTNLQSFPDVVVLDLSFNKIQILEAGLFDLNLKIEKLYLNGNQIFAVVLTVFNKLKESSILYMDGNGCQVNKSNSNSWTSIKDTKEQFKKKNDCTKDENIKITRLMVKVEKVEANFQYIYTLNSNRANQNESNLTGTINHMQNEILKLTNESKYLKDKIDQIEQNQPKYTELEKKIGQFELKWNRSNDGEKNVESKSEIPEIPLYICSILLLSILIALIIIICRNKGPSKTSNSTIKFQSVASHDLMTVTQIDENEAQVEPPPRDYNSLKPYDYYKSNESQSNASHNIPTFNNRSFANEIYGTAIVEDLYSEQISPKRMNHNERVEEQSELYAVVSKPKNK